MANASYTEIASQSHIYLRVPSKVNIYLQVGRIREDGYHDITTVYQAVGIYDEMKIMRGYQNSGLTMTVSGVSADRIPTDSRNLVLKAARALAKYKSINPSTHFELVKKIPTEAGLGGGSADAAAALVGCNVMWKLDLGKEDLMAIGAQISEDIPIFIHGGMAIGVGHRQPLISLSACSFQWHWVLGIPIAGLETRRVFCQVDKLENGKWSEADYAKRHANCLQVKWSESPPESLKDMICNDLAAAATSLLPEIEFALAAGRSAGALSSTMTGAGSTCIFLAKDKSHSEMLSTNLRKLSIFREVLETTGPVAGVEVESFIRCSTGPHFRTKCS